MQDGDRSRISEAFDELAGYRDDGENVIDNLEAVATFHRVPTGKLRELAEKKWGSPLETDRERNAQHFEEAARRAAERATAHAYHVDMMFKAKQAAIGVWDSCRPNGEPDWDYCAKRFLSSNKIQNAGLRIEITNLFQSVGSDFRKASALYNKWHVR